MEQRQLNQWFLRITDYAEPLLNDLDGKPWPERCAPWWPTDRPPEGAEISFSVEGAQDQTTTVFTTRPDTSLGQAAWRWHRKRAGRQPPQRRARQAEGLRARSLTHDRRTSMTGLARRAHQNMINPLTGVVLPVWIADYVLAEYGTGAVMGVQPTTRDIGFAQANDLPIQQVIDAKGAAEAIAAGQAWTDAGTLINSGAFDGTAWAKPRAPSPATASNRVGPF